MVAPETFIINNEALASIQDTFVNWLLDEIKDEIRDIEYAESYAPTKADIEYAEWNIWYVRWILAHYLEIKYGIKNIVDVDSEKIW